MIVNASITGIIPTGTKDVDANGIHDVSNYKNVNVQIEGGGLSNIDASIDEQDPTSWGTGYHDNKGGTASFGALADDKWDSNFTATYLRIIPVEPSTSYTVYNTNPDWTTDWCRMIRYNADDIAKARCYSTKSSPISTPTITSTDHFSFETDTNTYGLTISLRNMKGYTDTFKICKTSDYVG